MLLAPAAPPPLSQPSVAAFSAVPSLGPSFGAGVSSLAAQDAAFALPTRQPLPRLSGPAADFLAVAALTPRLDASPSVADRAGMFAGTSGAHKPMASMPLLDPANNLGVCSDRSPTSARDGSGAGEDNAASAEDFLLAVALVDAAAATPTPDPQP
jgi:hypothetical protein